MSCLYAYNGKMYSKEELINVLPFNELEQIFPLKQLSDEEVDLYNSKLEGKTAEQKNTVEKLLLAQRSVSLDEKTHTYLDLINNKEMKSTTSRKEEDPRYVYKGDPTLYPNNAAWGNQVDHILESVILDKPLDTIKKELSEMVANNTNTKANLSDDVISELYESFTEYLQEYPNDVLLTQQILSNKDPNINTAGSADIIAVKPDGSIEIIDLKTSTSNPDNYYKGFGDTGVSKHEIYRAQLSMYQGLAMSMGIPVKGLKVKRFFLPEGNDVDVVTKITDLGETEVMPKEEWLNKTRLNRGQDTTTVAEKAADKFFKNIVLKIEEEIAKLKNLNKRNQAEYFEYLKYNLEDAAQVNRISGFVNMIYNQVFGSSNYSGDLNNLNNLWKDIMKGNYKSSDSETKLEALYKYKNTAEFINSNLLSEIRKFYDLYEDEMSDAEPDSPLGKIKQLISASEEMNSKIKDAREELLGEILGEEIDAKLTEAAKKELDVLTRRLERAESKGNKKTIQRINGEIARFKRRHLIDKDSLKGMLRDGGYDNIGFIDAFVTPVIKSSNAILATFAKKVKRRLEQARLKVREFTFDAEKKFKQFTKGKSITNQAQLYDGLHEEINFRGKKRASFTQMFSVSDYIGQLETLQNNGDSYRKALLKTSKLRPKEDITLTDSKGNSIVLVKGVDTILNEIKDSMTTNGKLNEKRYNYWLKKNYNVDKGYFSRDFYMPQDRFLNPKFKELKNSPDKLDMYVFLMGRYLKDVDSLPIRKGLFERFLLPSVRKSTNDRIIENGFGNYFKDTLNDALRENEYDADETGKTAEGSLRIIPVLYSQAMESQDVTRDLLLAVTRFHLASEKYKAQSDLRTVAENLRETVALTDPVATDSWGNALLTKASKKLNMPTEALDQYNRNGVLTALDHFIDAKIYSKTRKRGAKVNLPILGEVDMAKLADATMRYQSLTSIAVNPILSVSNLLTGRFNTALEAVSGRYFNKSDYAWATKEYERNEIELAKDDWVHNGIPHSKLGHLIDAFDAIQGQFEDKLGRKMTVSRGKRLLTTDTLYKMQEKGEHHVQVVAMLSVLKGTKVNTRDGKQISLYDAYKFDKKNNTLTLDANVRMEGNIINGLIPENVQNRIHSINKELHGVYNNFDKSAAEQYTLGRLMLMFRKFLVPGFKRRYKSLGVDREMGDITEGFYNTFWRTLREDSKALLPWTEEYKQLTDRERHNLKRSMAEMTMIFLTGSAIWILNSMAEGMDDDEENVIFPYVHYLTTRFNAEIGYAMGFGDPRSLFLGNPQDLFRIMRSPVASWGVVEKTVKFIMQFTDPLEEYERDYGPWKKGDLKLKAKTLKLLGYSGLNTHPDEGLKVLQLQLR